MNDYPDKKLRGYVGEVIDARGHEVKLRFAIVIDNTTAEAWIPLRYVRYVQT